MSNKYQPSEAERRQGVTDEMVERAAAAIKAIANPNHVGEVACVAFAEAALNAALSLPAAQDGGMLPDELDAVSAEWYSLCERAAYVERMPISGELAEAIVKTICRLNSTPNAIRGDKGAEAPCEFCGGRGFTDDGHVEWDGQVVSAPEGCVECDGRGTLPAAPTQAAAKEE